MQQERIDSITKILLAFPQELQDYPKLVTKMAEICLSFRRENADLAIISLRSYLEWRLKLFGDLEEQCITKDPKLRSQLESGFMHLSPMRLSNGEALLYLSNKNHDPSHFSTTDTIKCLHYFIISAMVLNPSLAESGFVIVNNMVDVEMKNMDMNFPAVIAGTVGKSMPIRLVALAIITPPMLIRCVIPMFKAVLPPKLVNRMHVVTDLNTLPDLISATAQVCLPVELGGAVEFSTKEDLARLVSMEMSI